MYAVNEKKAFLENMTPEQKRKLLHTGAGLIGGGLLGYGGSKLFGGDPLTWSTVGAGGGGLAGYHSKDLAKYFKPSRQAIPRGPQTVQPVKQPQAPTQAQMPEMSGWDIASLASLGGAGLLSGARGLGNLANKVIKSPTIAKTMSAIPGVGPLLAASAALYHAGDIQKQKTPLNKAMAVGEAGMWTLPTLGKILSSPTLAGFAPTAAPALGTIASKAWPPALAAWATSFLIDQAAQVAEGVADEGSFNKKVLQQFNQTPWFKEGLKNWFTSPVESAKNAWRGAKWVFSGGEVPEEYLKRRRQR